MLHLHLPSIIVTILAMVACICGMFLLLFAPRLVGRVDNGEDQSALVHALIVRWIHLFGLEILSCLLLYYGLCTYGLFPALAPLPVLLIAVLVGLLLSCLLCRYL
ncbi:hypothetical protein [Tengunoibacter tsumagoiensis]|uniref:Uncharacterized protein n=1 Tax=Tengunoibacter tsumagoiensis TaxID=2014871 RepID=A0A402A6V4_9CHLR|nr:hypothetical protein [Tengunoibacter tsumagoiensis]GCE14756.1 hypothetical protein KTT_46150 [Tengunoibacter tsumagoiensis]